MDGLFLRQAIRIERDRFDTLKLAVAVAKASDLRAVWQGLHFQQRRRHRVQGAGELDTDA